LVFLHAAQEYFIVLKSVETESVFLMQTGYVEACSVYGAMYRRPHPNPLTYQLFQNLVHALDASIVEVVFDGYNKDIQGYESHLVVSKRGSTVNVKCRGSDAVGIAFLARIPIRVNTAFLGGVARD
jgi:bifunctional DNase/RNase